jgi:hypothetical protein
MGVDIPGFQEKAQTIDHPSTMEVDILGVDFAFALPFAFAFASPFTFASPFALHFKGLFGSDQIRKQS